MRGTEREGGGSSWQTDNTFVFRSTTSKSAGKRNKRFFLMFPLNVKNGCIKCVGRCTVPLKKKKGACRSLQEHSLTARWNTEKWSRTCQGLPCPPPLVGDVMRSATTNHRSTQMHKGLLTLCAVSVRVQGNLPLWRWKMPHCVFVHALSDNYRKDVL